MCFWYHIQTTSGSEIARIKESKIEVHLLVLSKEIPSAAAEDYISAYLQYLMLTQAQHTDNRKYAATIQRAW